MQGSTIQQLLVGPKTNLSVLRAYLKDCERRRPSSMKIILYRADRSELSLFVQLCPLYSADWGLREYASESEGITHLACAMLQTIY